LEQQEIELILLDLTMPHISGMEILKRLRVEYPYIPVIIVTGINEIDTAVECVREGAVDYMVKAVEENRLISGVRQALENRKLKREYHNLKSLFFNQELSRPDVFASIITRSEKMHSIFLFIETIAKSSQTVLITGETGTGKELIAEAIHRISPRQGDYIKVNIAGLDDTMFSDTLFGHKRGAFTGAGEARKGLIDKAKEGTLFLDEIGDLSPSSQIKLLRLLESGEYYPLGADLAKRSYSRLLVATNRDVTALVEEEGMRKDLYYRINAHGIHLPPLRERSEDIPLLIEHFTELAAREFDKPIYVIPDSVYKLLKYYRFTGNIRELRSIIFDAVSRSRQGVVDVDRIAATVGSEVYPSNEHVESENMRFPENLPTIKEVTAQLIAEALERTGGNQAKAARMLGITPQALSKRMRKSDRVHR
jgi:DNA-binding NtrC family response regulator